jgi:hypothetical protein
VLKEFELTDGSRELANVGKIIRDADKVKGQNVLIGFGTCFDVDPAGPVFFELLSVLRNRIHSLEQFARTVVDRELDDSLRGEVVAATKAFAQLFAPQQLVTVWDSTRASCLPDANLKTLTWFGQTARRHRPLRVVSDQERLALIEKIDEALRGLDDDLLTDWRKEPLREGLMRLQTILKFFKVFGHEAAIQELLLFNRKVESLSEAHSVADSFLTSFEFPSLRKALEITALVGALFTLPDTTVTAFGHYVEWQRRMIASATDQTPKPRLLAPPVAALPSPTTSPKRSDQK